MIEEMLERFITKNNLKDKYDFIFIDCPPTYSNYTVSSLLPSDYYITPVKPDTFSILGLRMMYKVVDDIMDTKYKYFENKNLINLGVIFTGIKRTPMKSEASLIKMIRESKVLEEHNTYVFDAIFQHNSHLRSKLDYFIMDSRSEQSIMNLSTIYDEFMERIEASEQVNFKENN